MIGKMSDNSFKNFFSRAWEFIKSVAKIVWNYLKIAKMEWIVMIGLFALDLISKTIVEKTLGYHNELTLIPNFLAFELIPNYNAAYGADFVSKWLGTMGARIFFSVFAVAASVAFILVLIKNKGKSKVFRIGIAMFVAGAMGNCIDRMFIGWVRDFVHFTFQPYIFNIADAELIFGVVLIVVYFLFLYRDSDKRKEQPTAPLVDDLGEIAPVDMTAETGESSDAGETAPVDGIDATVQDVTVDDGVENETPSGEAPAENAEKVAAERTESAPKKSAPAKRRAKRSAEKPVSDGQVEQVEQDGVKSVVVENGVDTERDDT